MSLVNVSRAARRAMVWSVRYRDGGYVLTVELTSRNSPPVTVSVSESVTGPFPENPSSTYRESWWVVVRCMSEQAAAWMLKKEGGRAVLESYSDDEPAAVVKPDPVASLGRNVLTRSAFGRALYEQGRAS